VCPCWGALRAAPWRRSEARARARRQRGGPLAPGMATRPDLGLLLCVVQGRTPWYAA